MHVPKGSGCTRRPTERGCFPPSLAQAPRFRSRACWVAVAEEAERTGGGDAPSPTGKIPSPSALKVLSGAGNHRKGRGASVQPRGTLRRFRGFRRGATLGPVDRSCSPGCRRASELPQGWRERRCSDAPPAGALGSPGITPRPPAKAVNLLALTLIAVRPVPRLIGRSASPMEPANEP